MKCGPYVPATGPKDAKLAIVGMAPGTNEEAEGKPFVGASGALLWFVMSKCGVSRDEVYVSNVSKYRPPNNDLSRLKELGIDRKEQVEELMKELKEVNPRCILALGDDAMLALTGKIGVMKWRGSILKSDIGCKVVPSFHPAAILRAGHIAVKDEGQTRTVPLLPMLMFDAERACNLSKNEGFTFKSRKTIIPKTIGEVREYCEYCKSVDKIVIDIETLRGEVSCIGFAPSEKEAMCVPFDTGMNSYWTSKDEESEAWQYIIMVLRSPVKKIIQNALFELQFLGGPEGVSNVWWDTMLAEHVLYPELPKSLAFLTSIYTDIPYYKWRGREWRPGDPPSELWEYNGLDCMATFEVQEGQEKDLREAGLGEVFEGIVMPQLFPAHEMEVNGLRCSLEVMRELRMRQEGVVEELQKQLNDTAGWEVNVNSPLQMRKFLFEQMKLPKPRLRKGATYVSTDEATLEKLALKHPSPIFDLVIKIRESRKAISTYLQDGLIDWDSRMRSSLRVGGTETGRMASGKNVWGRGMNQQNIPKPFRRMFVHDDGEVMIEIDGKQAEARLVAWEADEPKLKQIFKMGWKVHSVVAGMIFEKPVPELSPMEYDLGKRVVHGSNYGLGADRFVEVAKKYGGITVDVSKARWLLEKYHALFPNIRNVYHKKVQEALRQTRTLTTCFGRKRTFSGVMGEELFKEGYAYLAQSAIADWLNMGMCRCYWRFKSKGLKVRWLGQLHDAFLFSLGGGERTDDIPLFECVRMLREEMEKPFLCNNEMLVIPIEIKVGMNWYEMEEVKGGE